MSHEINYDRRRALRALGAALAGGSVGATLACADSSSPTSPTMTTTGGTTSGACVEAASETRGPYPDQTGMLNNQGFYRQDIREGRTGLALSLALTIVNSAQLRSGCQRRRRI
jgi:hypothetical protein